MSCFVIVWGDGSVNSSTGGGALVWPSVPRKERKQLVGCLDLVDVTQLEHWLVTGGHWWCLILAKHTDEALLQFVLAEGQFPQLD